jgi:hypothetical protein
MKLFIKSLSLFLFIATSVAAQAQNEVEMADAMRANGKIYVVVSIVLLVLLGLFAYLLVVDRKISGLEKKVKG